jgi:large subunit ribosomal protein L19
VNREIMKKAEAKFMVKRPELKVGDTVVVDTVIRDGDKKRIQKFKGLVIAVKGKELSK